MHDTSSSKEMSSILQAPSWTILTKRGFKTKNVEWSWHTSIIYIYLNVVNYVITGKEKKIKSTREKFRPKLHYLQLITGQINNEYYF